MTSTQRLGDFTDVRNGLSLRKTGETVPAGSHQLIQISSYNRDMRSLDVEFLPRVSPKGDVLEHVIKAEDILLANKSATGLCFVPDVTPLPAVASDSFFILRPDPEVVEPDYLAWYLSHPSTVRILENLSGGSRTKVLRKDNLVDLEIPIPPRNIQYQISRITELAHREEEVLNRLRQKRKTHTDALTYLLATRQEPTS